MTSYSDIKPSIFLKINNSSYLYRMNIEQVTENDTTSYKYDEYTVYTPLNSNTILKSVLNESYDKDYEQKLINDYNSVKLGLSTDETKVTNYTTFLKERDSIKTQIETDCKSNNINI